MKFGLFLILALVLCTAVVLASAKPQDLVVRDGPESPSSEGPEKASSSENPEAPYVPENPEQPSSSDPEQPSSQNPEQPSSSSQESPAQPTESPSSNSNDETSSSEIHFCTMMVLECPDGSFATQNSQCEYICGAAPIGGLSWESVNSIRVELERAYGSRIWNTAVSELHSKYVNVTAPEKLSDYCIDAYIYESDRTTYPAAYNGVRVFYLKSNPSCSPIVCPDGSYVGCNMECPSASSESNSLFMPFTLVFGVVLMSACCCCIRRRRCKQQCKQGRVATPVTPISTSHDVYYPADHYELLQQQLLQEQLLHEQAYGHQEEAGIPPHMMGQPMMFPPMPPVPPQMMQNGTYPVMIQGPNGVWYMAAPHPEDV